MQRTRLALYTFGVFRLPSEHPANQGFHECDGRNLLAAEQSDGFVARSGYDGEAGPACWGEQVYPRFYRERGDGWSPSTLSLWSSLEALMAFTYAGIHAEALKRGRDWFVKPEWPPYVLWWVEPMHTPTWAEAVDRHEFLHDHDPGPFAFDFKNPFDAGGQPATIDRDAMKGMIARNAKRLA